MIHDATTDTLIILKFFKKYKGCWFNATAVSHELDIPKSRVKGILNILVGNGLIEHDKEYFYRFKENEQKMISAEEVREYQKKEAEKIDVTSYLMEIEEIIKANMSNLKVYGINYEFKEYISNKAIEKIKKILKDNGYEVLYINPSHYYECGGLTIKWGE